MQYIRTLLANKRAYLPIYIILLLLGGLFVRHVLNTDTSNIEEVSQVDQPAKEKHPVDVILRVEEPVNKSFTIRMNDTDSVTDLMNKIRDQDPKIFKYEKTIYTYGLEFDSINGITPPAGQKWRVFDGSNDITDQVEEYKLRDNTAYTLKLIRTEEPQ